MAQTCFHPSVEGAQHGAKSLADFLAYAKKSGAAGAQPSNYMLQAEKGFKSAQEIKAAFEKAGMKLDGISAHCPFWVHTTAWTGSPSIRPFIPAEVARKPIEQIEKWAEDYIFALYALAAELGVKVLPIYLCHEIHPGTAAMCADDFNLLVKICDGDKSLGVNADPSHCWEGEDWETRFRKVGDRVHACHVKNFVIRSGLPLRMMEPNWPGRAMQFVDLPSGDLNLARYVEMLVNIGYPQRYCQFMGTQSAPLIVEAESAYRDLDATSANGIQFVRDNLCFPLAAGSFEEGMGA